MLHGSARLCKATVHLQQRYRALQQQVAAGFWLSASRAFDLPTVGACKHTGLMCSCSAGSILLQTTGIGTSTRAVRQSRLGTPVEYLLRLPKCECWLQNMPSYCCHVSSMLCTAVAVPFMASLDVVCPSQAHHSLAISHCAGQLQAWLWVQKYCFLADVGFFSPW
jgi:hypothetical protein